MAQSGDYRSNLSTSGTVAGAFFMIWGILGFIGMTVQYFSLTGSVGVGTSAYLALGMLYWIGGMVLFGFCAVLSERRIEGWMRDPAVKPPAAVPEGYEGVLEGYPYRHIAGAQIEYLTIEGPKIAATWREFFKIVGPGKR